MIDAPALHDTWPSLSSCRDITHWLEGVSRVPVHEALMQLESAPGPEPIVAVATYVGMRRQLLAERWLPIGRELDLADLRQALSSNVRDDEGLADACLELMAEQASGRPLSQLAGRLAVAHGLSPVLAMTSFARALGALLLQSPEGYSGYEELYSAEAAWMSRHASCCLSSPMQSVVGR